jgi:hypothetical protein
MSSIKKRVYNKSTYSATTISTFDVVAAYLVDIYYNELYGQAVKWKNANKVPSVTEGYKHTVAMFVSAMSNESKKKDKIKYYEDVLNGIKEYFTLYTSFATLTISDCINKITYEFIPNDYFNGLTKEHQRSILRNSLNNVIREFSKRVIRDFIRQIIDNHEESANIPLLKECIVDLLINEREMYYHKFLDSTGGNQSETIDKSLAIKMQQEIKTLSIETTTLTKDLSEAKEQNNEHIKHIKQLINKYKSLEVKYKNLKNEYDAKMQRSFKQHTNLPTNYTTNQPINQPINYTTNQPTNYTTNQPINLPIKQPINYSTNQPTNLPTNQQANYTIQQLINTVNKTNHDTTHPAKPLTTKPTTKQVKVKPPTVELPDIMIESDEPIEIPSIDDDSNKEINLESEDDDYNEPVVDNTKEKLTRAISSFKNDLGMAPSISDIY